MENYESLILTSRPLELDPTELVSLSDGKRYVPSTDAFDTGYHISCKVSVQGVNEIKRILTFAERQLPTKEYKGLFRDFLRSQSNLLRAKNLGMERVSQFAGDSIDALLSVTESA